MGKRKGTVVVSPRNSRRCEYGCCRAGVTPRQRTVERRTIKRRERQTFRRELAKGER